MVLTLSPERLGTNEEYLGFVESRFSIWVSGLGSTIDRTGSLVQIHDKAQEIWSEHSLRGRPETLTSGVPAGSCGGSAWSEQNLSLWIDEHAVSNLAVA